MMTIEAIAPTIVEHRFDAPDPADGAFLLGAARLFGMYNRALARGEATLELLGVDDPVAAAAEAEETAWYCWDRHLFAMTQHVRPEAPRAIQALATQIGLEENGMHASGHVPTSDISDALAQVIEDMPDVLTRAQIREAQSLRMNAVESQRLAEHRELSTLELLILCEALAHRLETAQDISQRRDAEWVGHALGLLAPNHVTFDLESIK